MKKLAVLVVSLICVPVALMAVWSVAMGWPDNWRTADWSSARIAPNPASAKEAIIQIYAARAGRWKGIFSVHTWIVIKPRNAVNFTRYDVVGWGKPVRRNNYPADGFWYGNSPEVILEIRGEEAGMRIAGVEEAIRSYPFSERGSYRAWPGPNSNTFVSWIGRQVPALGLEMPANAVGKDFLGEGIRVSRTPSGTGWQVSAWGLVGVAVAWHEGIEIHLLGATIGLDFNNLGVKLPGLGTLAFA